MRKMGQWVNCRRGAGLGVAAGLLCLALVTGGQAAADLQGKGTGVEKPVQGLQVCPANGPCQVQGESPANQPPGKTNGKTLEQPKVKQPVKSQKKSKLE